MISKDFSKIHPRATTATGLARKKKTLSDLIKSITKGGHACLLFSWCIRLELMTWHFGVSSGFRIRSLYEKCLERLLKNQLFPVVVSLLQHF